MFEVTVKTLDSQNHSYSIPDDITVKDFKERIAPSLGIPADKQRLIFCGRVLQDDKKLAEYDVNGKVIHLVQRPPPQSARSGAGSSSSSASNSNRNTSGGASLGGANPRDGGSFLLGAFTIPHDMIDPAQVEQIVQDVVSGMGEVGRNATVMSRTSEDGSSVDVHINLGHVPLQSAAQVNLRQCRRFIAQANSLLTALENSQNSSESATGEKSDAPMQTESEDAVSSSQPQPQSSRPDTTAANDGAERMTRSSSDTQLYNLDHNQQSGSGEARATAGAEQDAVSSRIRDNVAMAARAAAAAAISAATRAASSMFPALGLQYRGSMPNGGANVGPERQERSHSADNLSFPSSRSDRPNQRSEFLSERMQRTESATHPREVADILEQVMRLQGRMQPWMQRFLDMLRDDPVHPEPERSLQNQQLFNNISQILHYVSHIYHSLSDFHVNYSAPPPRTVRAVYEFQAQLAPAAVIHAGIPLQIHLAMGGQGGNRGTSSTPSTTTTTPPATTAADMNSARRNSSQDSSPGNSQPEPRPQVASVHIPTGSEGGPQLFTAQNPLVFMELGSGSITIDSISTAIMSRADQFAHVAAAAAAAANVGNNQGNNGTTPSPLGSNTVPTTSGSTGTRTSAISTGPGPLRSVTASLPFPSMMNGFDSSLPCNSRWAASQTQASASASASAGPNPSGTSRIPTSTGHPTQQQHARQEAGHGAAGQANGTEQVDDQLHQVISGLMTAVLQQPHIYVHGGRTPSNTAAAPASGGSGPGQPASGASRSATFSTGPAGGTDGSPWGPNPPPGMLGPMSFRIDPSWIMGQFFQHQLQQGRTPAQSGGQPQQQRTESEGNQSSVPPSAPTRPAQQATGARASFNEDIFNNLIQGVMSQMAGADENSQTVGEFLSRLDDYAYREGENLMSDLFMCIAQQLHFRDFVALFFGQMEPLGRIRSHLCSFVLQRILHIEPTADPSTPTDQDIRVAVDAMLERGRENFHQLTREANVKPEVDYMATVLNLFRERLRDIVAFVLRTEGPNFGTDLYDRCRRMISEFIVVSLESFTDREASLDRMIQAKIRQMSTAASPLVRQWMLNIASTEICAMTRNITITPQDVSCFMVPSSAPQSSSLATSSRIDLLCPSGGARPGSIDSNMETSPAPEVTTSSEEPMETEPVRPQEVSRENGITPTTSDAEVRSAFQLSPMRNIREANVKVDSQKEDLPDVVIGSEPWHTSIPQEWVPIITCDVQRQRRNAPPRPFSDGYLSGMPSKRRRLMGVSQEVMRPMQSLIPESLQRAISNAGVQPLTSVEEVKKEASTDLTLHDAYRQQVTSTVRHRLQKDLDYSPSRFPNTEDYFNK